MCAATLQTANYEGQWLADVLTKENASFESSQIGPLNLNERICCIYLSEYWLDSFKVRQKSSSKLAGKTSWRDLIEQQLFFFYDFTAELRTQGFRYNLHTQEFRVMAKLFNTIFSLQP